MQNASVLVRESELALEYIKTKIGALNRPDGRYLARQEKRLENRVLRRFNRQRKWLVERIAELSFLQPTKGVRMVERKASNEEIRKLVDEMPEHEEIVASISNTASGTYKRGARTVHVKLNMAESGISFELVNPRAVRYLRQMRNLHLSDRQGSITHETRKRIIKILADAADSGASYTETAKLIQEQGDAGVFSRARAELIAVNQVGHAYGEGNSDMVDIYRSQTGAVIEKFWQTVGDDRVTPECRANEDTGWLPFQSGFPSGDTRAPRATNPRCRCVVVYRRVEPQDENS